jgi:DNA-directed RNA polymerase subunit L
MNQKIAKFREAIATNAELVTSISNKTTLVDGFEIILENEDYTLGKVIEFLIYEKYYIAKQILDFCGFRKPHPHIPLSIIRVAYSEKFKPSTETDVTNSDEYGDADIRGGASQSPLSSSSNVDRVEQLKTYTLGMIKEVCDNATTIYGDIERMF